MIHLIWCSAEIDDAQCHGVAVLRDDIVDATGHTSFSVRECEVWSLTCAGQAAAREHRHGVRAGSGGYLLSADTPTTSSPEWGRRPEYTLTGPV